MIKQRANSVSRVLAVLVLIVVFRFDANAQRLQSEPRYPQDTVQDNKPVLLEAYLFFAGMKGTIGLGNLPDAEVDESFGDIVENLEMGAMLYVEANVNPWAISSDFIYMRLGSDINPSPIINSGSAEARQLSWEVGVIRKLLPWLEAGIGLQLNNIKSELDLNFNTPNGPVERSSELDETWIDPLIIARVKYPLGQNWLLLFRPSIGGFGVASDLTWQIQARATYRVSPLFQISAGYRVVGVDYEKGSGQDRFLYDINSFGPEIRFGFNF